MLHESKKVSRSIKISCIDGRLMKPFALGWTREVVNRVIRKNSHLTCDIYYFSPTGKKLRSLTEIKSNLNLIDGLSLECFSFKKKPLGINGNYERVRDAKVRQRKKGSEVCNGKLKYKAQHKKLDSNNVQYKKLDSNNAQTATLKNGKNVESLVEKNLPERQEYDDDIREIESSSRTIVENTKCQTEVKKTRKSKTLGRKSKLERTYVTQNKVETKAEEVFLRPKSARRKALLKKIVAIKEAKPTRGTASKKITKKLIKKGSPKVGKLCGAKADKETSKIKVGSITKITKKPLKLDHTKDRQKEIEEEEEKDKDETEKKSGTRDLRSIVKKNIGKYREMREQQKLAIKSQLRMHKKKVVVKNVKQARSEPISKYSQLYMKPLKKGWKRELVFRRNSTKAGQCADVYYLHPSGKRLRSFREVSENLTPGLTIEYFTFRKEAIGCGEPSEIIRNARINTKQTI